MRMKELKEATPNIEPPKKENKPFIAVRTSDISRVLLILFEKYVMISHIFPSSLFSTYYQLIGTEYILMDS